LSKRSTKDWVYPESCKWCDAAVQIFPNGLARAAWNCVTGVDADGNPVRYQWGAYVSMQNEWAIFRQFGW